MDDLQRMFDSVGLGVTVAEVLAPLRDSLSGLRQLCRFVPGPAGEALTMGLDASGPEFAHVVWGPEEEQHAALAEVSAESLWNALSAAQDTSTRMTPLERSQVARSGVAAALCEQVPMLKLATLRLARLAATEVGQTLVDLGAAVVLEHGTRWSVTKRAYTQQRLQRVKMCRSVWMETSGLLLRSPWPTTVTQRRCCWCGLAVEERAKWDWRAEQLTCPSPACGRVTAMSENVARVLYANRHGSLPSNVVEVEMEMVSRRRPWRPGRRC